MSRAHRHVLSKSEAREVALAIERALRSKRSFDVKARWEVVKISKNEVVYLLDGRPLAVEVSGKLIPSIRALMDGIAELPRVVVDSGAVKHVVNGADVMAPGIVRVEGDFVKGDLVVVVDEKHGKPLSVGVALVDRSELASMSRGKVVENLHYIGDKLWNKLKEMGLM
jgi:PUA domain protein